MVAGLPKAGAVGFNRDVRPILSINCFACHGPDERARKAKLRLDVRESALQVIEPGAPEKSELIARVTHADVDERMPPRETHKSVTPEEVAVLEAWIKDGAKYEAHWAFIPPVRVEIPEGVDTIDHFVRARLQEEGLEP